MGPGLTPGDAISVEPRGMPVAETGEPVDMPSGEVAPMVGVGLAIPLTCAMAALQTTNAGRTAAINENLTCILRFEIRMLARIDVARRTRIELLPSLRARLRSF